MIRANLKVAGLDLTAYTPDAGTVFNTSSLTISNIAEGDIIAICDCGETSSLVVPSGFDVLLNPHDTQGRITLLIATQSHVSATFSGLSGNIGAWNKWAK